MPDDGFTARNEIRIDTCPSCQQEDCDPGCGDDDAEDRKHEIKRWEFQIAFLVVAVVLFLLCVVVVSDVVLQFRGGHLQVPKFLMDICQLTITAGLTFLGVGALQTGRTLLRKHKEQQIGKGPEDG